MTELDRYKRALAFISISDSGGEIFPSGPREIIRTGDGSAIVAYKGPWFFLFNGEGKTFLEAVEDAMAKEFALEEEFGKTGSLEDRLRLAGL